MKQRPETLFFDPIPSGCLLYGNNPSIEDYLVLDLIPKRLNASSSAIKAVTETELLALSKEKLYLETALFDAPKLYIIKEVTDKFLPLIQSYEPFVPMVMVGKNLKSSSKLVSYISTHPKYNAIPIYGDEPSFLNAFIQHQLKGFNAEPDVAGCILNHLHTFGCIRQQINVLLQFFSKEDTLTVNAVEQIFIPSEQTSIFQVAEAIISKNPRAMLSLFPKAQAIFQKETIPLLRITAKHCWDLVTLRRQIDQGQSPQQVVNQATPFIPFNRRPQIIHNLSKWTVKGLLNAVVVLDELEVLAKQPIRFSADQLERSFLQLTKL